MKTIKTLLALAILLSSEILLGQSPSFYDLTFKADSTTTPYVSPNNNYAFIRSKRGADPVKPTSTGDSIKSFSISKIVLVFSESSSSAIENREEYNQERWENLMGTYPEFFQAKTVYSNVCQCSPDANNADFKLVQGFYIYYTPKGGSEPKKEVAKEEPKKEVEVAKVETAKKVETKKEEPKKEVAKDDSKKEDLKKAEAEKVAELAKKEEQKKEELKKKEAEKEAEVAKKEELKKEELKKKEAEKEAELSKKEELKKEEQKKKEAEKVTELAKKEELNREELRKEVEMEEVSKKEEPKKEEPKKVIMKDESKKEAEVVKKEEPKKEAIASDSDDDESAEAEAKRKSALPSKPRRSKDLKACRSACYGTGESDLNAYFRDNIVLTKKMRKDEVDLKLQLNFDGTVKKVIILGQNTELNKLVEEAAKTMVWNATVKAGLTIKSEVRMLLKYDKDLKGLKANNLTVNPRLGPKCMTCTSDSDLFPN